MIVAYWSRSCEEGPGSLKYFAWTRHNPYSTTCRIGTLQERMHCFGRSMEPWQWWPETLWKFKTTSTPDTKSPRDRWSPWPWCDSGGCPTLPGSTQWLVAEKWKLDDFGINFDNFCIFCTFWIILMFLDILIVTSSTLETRDDSTDLWKMSFWSLQWMMESEELSGLSYASPSVV